MDYVVIIIIVVVTVAVVAIIINYCCCYKNFKSLKEVVKVRKQVASYLARKLLDIHSTSIGYYLCLFMKTQFQLYG